MTKKKQVGYFLLGCAALTSDLWIDSVGLACFMIGFWLVWGEK